MFSVDVLLKSPTRVKIWPHFAGLSTLTTVRELITKIVQSHQSEKKVYVNWKFDQNLPESSRLFPEDNINIDVNYFKSNFVVCFVLVFKLVCVVYTQLFRRQGAEKNIGPKREEITLRWGIFHRHEFKFRIPRQILVGLINQKWLNIRGSWHVWQRRETRKRYYRGTANETT